MTQRRDLEARLAVYNDLAGILGAMRSFALAELRRLSQSEPAQRQAAASVADAYAAVASALQEPVAEGADTWLLLGSVRGFCASFNEDVLRLWQAAGSNAPATIVVGERLSSIMPASSSLVAVSGAIGAPDALATIDRILAALTRTLASGGLVACFRGDDGACTERLLPLPRQRSTTLELPAMNESAAHVATGVAQHFLFHRVLSLLMQSLRVENHMRLMQMENALQHIDRASETLQRQRSQLRQGEIIEEIESILRTRSRGTSAIGPFQEMYSTRFSRT